MIGPDLIVFCTLCDGLLVVTARDAAVGVQDVMVGLSAEDWPFHFCALTTCPHCGGFVWLNRMERVGGGFGDQEGLEARYPSARQVHNPHPDTLAIAVQGEEWASDGGGAARAMVALAALQADVPGGGADRSAPRAVRRDPASSARPVGGRRGDAAAGGGERGAGGV